MTSPDHDGRPESVPANEPKPARFVARDDTAAPMAQPEPTTVAEPHGRQAIKGSHPGDRYVRIVRQRRVDVQQAHTTHLVATEAALEARGSAGRIYGRIKRRMIGAPLASASAAHERLTKIKALAVLSSDALSSVAYATEEILRILVLAGIGALSVSLPIGAAIVALLIIVGVSYRQTIKAYPHGGGSYIVAKDNLGELPALTAAAALLFGYILTVAVSVSAGVAALVSAVPRLQGHLVLLGVGFIALVTIVNLRGIRESGTIFAVPTYLFLIGIAVMLAIGIGRNAAEGFAVHHPAAGSVPAATTSLGLLLILRAFSSGCAALTGVEAISDGVPAFQPPEWVNARSTLTAMITILAITFAGITFLSHQYGALPIAPDDPHYETVVSQIARRALGGENVAYYYVQFATLAILILAANTAYSDFPRLASFLARDGYVPHQFGYRGDRLAYSMGIITLGVLSGGVLVAFGGATERLIPLYAFGVFAAFTLSESGMVARWRTKREPGWRKGLAINLTGAIATGVVALVFGVSNFARGAWIVIVLIPLMILMFKSIRRHYGRVARALESSEAFDFDPFAIRHTIIVPIASVNQLARRTLAYSRSISSNVTAVHVTDDEDAMAVMRDAWNQLGTDVPLVIIESPYRALVGPLLAYIDEVDAQDPGNTLTVVLPEFVAAHWWEHLLHNQSALRLKAALLFRPRTVVISVPYHLDR